MNSASTRTSHAIRVRRIVLLAVVLAIPALFSLRLTVITDPDIWWHLRTGQWIVEHRALPATDPFSSFGEGKPWIAYSWLFDLTAYGLYRTWGLLGIVLMQTAFALATAVALFALARQFTASVASLALTAAGLLAMVPMYAPRPWLLTVLFFIFEIHLLLLCFADGRRRRLLWLIPMFVLWANIHIQFVYGLLVLGLAATGAAIAAVMRHTRNSAALTTQKTNEQDKASVCASTACGSYLPLSLWLMLPACVVATLANPFGWRIYRVVYEYSSQPAVFNLVTEFHALAFRSIPDFLVLLMTMAAAAALARSHAAWNELAEGGPQQGLWFEVLLLTTTAMLSFRSARDAWCVVVVAVALLARATGRETLHAVPLARRDFAAAATVLIVVVALVVAARQLNNDTLERHLAGTYPVQAARTVQAQAYSGQLYNHFNWGGYLIWSLPRLRVSMDGRTNVHGDKRIARSVATWNGDPGWQRDPELSAAGLVIAGIHDPLFTHLRHDNHFQLVYQDKVAGVFVARTAATRSLH